MSERPSFRSSEELEAALGQLSDSEKALLEDPSMYAPPTQQELDDLGPEFTQRVLEQLVTRLHRHHTQLLRQIDLMFQHDEDTSFCKNCGQPWVDDQHYCPAIHETIDRS